MLGLEKIEGFIVEILRVDKWSSRMLWRWVLSLIAWGAMIWWHPPVINQFEENSRIHEWVFWLAILALLYFVFELVLRGICLLFGPIRKSCRKARIKKKVAKIYPRLSKWQQAFLCGACCERIQLYRSWEMKVPQPVWEPEINDLVQKGFVRLQGYQAYEICEEYYDALNEYFWPKQSRV